MENKEQELKEYKEKVGKQLKALEKAITMKHCYFMEQWEQDLLAGKDPKEVASDIHVTRMIYLDHFPDGKKFYEEFRDNVNKPIDDELQHEIVASMFK